MRGKERQEETTIRRDERQPQTEFTSNSKISYFSFYELMSLSVESVL